MADLAHQALSIVLQQWMKFDLGWNIEFIQNHIVTVRQTIIECKRQHHGDNEADISQLSYGLSNVIGYVDSTWSAALETELNDITPDVMLQTIAPSMNEETQFYDLVALRNLTLQIFEKYFRPPTLMIEHLILDLTISLYGYYQTLHFAVVDWFRHQQIIYGNTSLLALQLKLWSRWEQHTRLLEMALFSFLLVGLIFEVDAGAILNKVHRVNSDPINRQDALNDISRVRNYSFAAFTYCSPGSLASQCVDIYHKLAKLLTRPSLMFRLLAMNRRNKSNKLYQFKQNTANSVYDEEMMDWQVQLHQSCYTICCLHEYAKYNEEYLSDHVESLPQSYETFSVTCGSLALAWQTAVLTSICFGLKYILPPNFPTELIDAALNSSTSSLRSLSDVLEVVSKRHCQVDFVTTSSVPIQRMHGFDEIDDFYLMKRVFPHVLRSVSIQTHFIRDYCKKEMMNIFHPAVLFSEELRVLLSYCGPIVKNYSEYFHTNQLRAPGLCRKMYGFTVYWLNFCRSVCRQAEDRNCQLQVAILESGDHVNIWLPFLTLTSPFIVYIAGSLTSAKLQDYKIRLSLEVFEFMLSRYANSGTNSVMGDYQELIRTVSNGFVSSTTSFQQNKGYDNSTLGETLMITYLYGFIIESLMDGQPLSLLRELSFEIRSMHDEWNLLNTTSTMVTPWAANLTTLQQLTLSTRLMLLWIQTVSKLRCSFGSIFPQPFQEVWVEHLTRISTSESHFPLYAIYSALAQLRLSNTTSFADITTIEINSNLDILTHYLNWIHMMLQVSIMGINMMLQSSIRNLDDKIALISARFRENMVESLSWILEQGFELSGLHSIFIPHLMKVAKSPDEIVHWLFQPCTILLQHDMVETLAKARRQVRETAAQWVKEVERVYVEAMNAWNEKQETLPPHSFFRLLSRL